MLTAFNNDTTEARNCSINDSIQVEFSEIEIQCLTLKEDKFIINDEKEYQKLFADHSSATIPCLSYKAPKINFHSNTLVGIITHAGGCEKPDIFKKVIKIPGEKKYSIRIQVRQKGFCKIHFTQQSWLLIPKTEKDYSIDFLIN